VPLELFFNRGKAKVTLALAKGKQAHDRREDIKRRIADREMARALSHRGRE
jgi:SsrA-binding protein